MDRFFVSKKVDDYFVLTKEQLDHLKVKNNKDKFNKNDIYFIAVYESNFYKVKLEINRAKIIEKINLNHEFEGEIVVAIALFHWDNFKVAIDAAVQLGATKIIPFTSRWSTVKKDFFDRKKDKLEVFMLHSSQQSFRNKLTTLEEVHKFEKLLDYEMPKFIAHSDLNDVQNRVYELPQNALFIIGPEGGFDESEIDFAKSKNTIPVSLSKTILRSEIAVIKMMSLVK